MISRFTILILFLLPLNDVRSDNSVYNIFQDFVQFSSSVDTYSDVCIRDFDQDKAKRDLFDLIDTFTENIELSELEISKLKEKYFRINQSTRSAISSTTQIFVNLFFVFSQFEHPAKLDFKVPQRLHLITFL